MFSVVLIVRDESAILPECLSSLGKLPDLVVCDTGSSDSTPAIAKDWGARVIDYSWCDDFAAARSFAEQYAKHDWIVRFDADERFFKHQGPQGDFAAWLTGYLEKANTIDAAQVFVRRFHDGNDEHWFPRVHRRSKFIWKYPVHERVVPRDGRWLPSLAAGEATIIHKQEHRQRSYRKILQKAVLASPNDPYLLFHLGRECFLVDDFWAAISALERCIDMTTGYRFHRSEAQMLIGRSLAELGELTGAYQALESAARLDHRAEPLWHAAQIAIRHGAFDRAMNYCKVGSTLLPPQERQPFGDYAPPYVTDMNCYGAAVWMTLMEAIDSIHKRTETSASCPAR